MKNLQAIKNFRKVVFLGCTRNHLDRFSVDRAEIAKICFFRQS